MSNPTVPLHTKRLANLVNRPGGMTEDEAITAATANLETMRERTLQEIDATMQRMQTIGQSLRAPPDPANLHELYTLSNTIVGIAGVFGLHGLSSVAYSLCELIDRLRTSRTWNAQAIRIHLDSLRAMYGTDPDEREAAEVREALRTLVERVPNVTG